MEYLQYAPQAAVILLLVIVIRNMRKDRSDGRDFFGGGSRGGAGRKEHK